MGKTNTFYPVSFIRYVKALLRALSLYPQKYISRDTLLMLHTY